MSESIIDDGGSAFPFGQISEVTGAPINGYFSDGMSLRDWFAGMAMQGWLSSFGPDMVHPVANDMEHEIAKQAYQMADAMIAARKGGAK